MALDLAILQLLIGSIIILAGSWLITFSLGKLIRGIATRAGASHAVIQNISDVMFVIWVVIAISGVATFTGLASVFAALTVSGLVGLVITLALQTTISNVISGIFLLSEGSIRADDEIEFGGVRGIVVKTALRNTWIRTKEGKFVVIGNTTLSGGPLINHSATERLNRKVMSDL